jgi:hypothetical protein
MNGRQRNISEFGQIVLVLQGGGALGAYQAGGAAIPGRGETGVTAKRGPASFGLGLSSCKAGSQHEIFLPAAT